ncbi:Enoyl-CoA delta isomerase 3 [Linum perenne]
MVESFRPIVAEMISLLMPTVAVVQGHAAAAGFALALSHDYVFMRSDKGVLYMSEVDLGLPFPDYFAMLFRAKLGSVAARRDVLLGGKKVRGEEAVRLEIVDGAQDSSPVKKYTKVEMEGMRFINGEEQQREIWRSVYGGLGAEAKRRKRNRRSR